ncbi:MAG TPA: ATP-binding cassette domain-containing protein [Nitrospinota bacterium]|jgi:ABC-2 type transport system ATP-binding protein|nr:ATP-binding cassette domain-containing protein [Nitrospinota bacterium]|tara:strand:+ start:12204 stop:13196 length:993 start_codon:yes stop_codon:yes gene_type:complete
MSKKMNIIEVTNLTKEFKTYNVKNGFWGAIASAITRKAAYTKAIDNINFSIKPGEFVGYVGENGAGKSTTIKILTGILVPTSGEALVNNIVPYNNRRENAKNIGVVFGQRTQLWWDLAVRESFDLLKSIYKIPEDRFKKNMEHFYEILTINKYLDVPVRKLSLGQRMRCDLAASLLHEPDVLFLDEPTIGLDVVAKDAVRKFLKEINEKKGTTIILTTHDMTDIEHLCDRIIILDEGKIISDGKTDLLKKNYGQHRVLEIEFQDKFSGINGIKGLKLLREEGSKKWIRFDSRDQSASDVISKIAANHQIKDLSIQEPTVEDIIKSIYSDS